MSNTQRDVVMLTHEHDQLAATVARCIPSHDAVLHLLNHAYARQVDAMRQPDPDSVFVSLCFLARLALVRRALDMLEQESESET